jgi:Fe-S-cluster containining protein
MMIEQHICSICAAQAQTCCQGQGRDIYITRGDLKRIKAFCGQEYFYEFRKPIVAAYLDHDDPFWLSWVFRPDSSRRVLKQNSKADCIFLSSNGCILPIHIRPLVCRLFPYEYNEYGFYDELAIDCPMCRIKGEQAVIHSLGMNKKDADAWRKLLYNEILWEKDDDEHRIDI